MSYLIVLLLPLICHAEPPQNFTRQWRVGADTLIVNTSENFDFSGKAQALPSDGELFNIYSQINLIFRPQTQWHLYAGADYSFTKASTNSASRTTGAIPYLRMGTNYFFTLKKFQLIPVFEAHFSIREVDPFGDDALVSDGVSQLSAGVWGGTRIKNWKPYLFLGLSHNTEGLASPYTVKLGTEFKWAKLKMWAEVSHIKPFIEDELSANPNNRWAIVNAVNAGSYRFYSVNPSHTDLGLGLGSQINSNLSGAFRVDYPLEGKNWAKGLWVTIRLAYEFGLTDSDQKILSTPMQEPIKNFKEKLEDADQNLFEP